MQHGGEAPVTFALTEERNARIAGATAEEMDIVAEGIARKMIFSCGECGLEMIGRVK
jgi:hypothetical protein